MSSNDSSSDLDSRISAIVESTVGRMRDELMHRMQDTESRLQSITSRLRGEDEPAAEPEPAAAPEPIAAPSGDVGGDLFDAVVAMDRGGSQQQVLAALLEGVGRFASRSALFLTRADAAQGWGSYGFEETAKEIQQVALSYNEGSLATLAEGRGCVALDAEECAELCREMGASPAAEGLLVPFVLRDRLAAALYVDRSADDPPLGRRSLQLLAYVGAQAVEGLALRKRDETPTLQVASAAAEAPGVALWEAPAPAEPEPEAAPPVEAAPPIEAPLIEAPPVEAPPVEAPPVEAPPVEAEPAEPATAAVEEAIEAPPAEMTLEELPEEEPPAELATEPMPAMEDAPEEAADQAWQVPAEPMDEPPPVAPEEAAPPVDSMPEPAAPEAAVEEQPWEATSGTGFSTAEAEPAPPPMPPVSEPSAAVGDTTEVRPPTDVTGPGWAFTASRAAAESGDDAQHEEARRLARLLVTEIKLYNEEQVEEGRRGNDIYARLREDIDRSRQIFNERVEEAVRQETDYFHEEMVRILGGGNAEALGI